MDSYSIKLHKSLLNEETACYARRLRLFESLKNFVSGNRLEGLTLLLHGSYAVGKLTPFSDIDVVAIFSFNTECDLKDKYWKQLRRITFFLHQYDPLMHHEVDIIDRDQFMDYDESTLPVATLERSILIFGDPHLEVKVNNYKSQIMAKRKLLRTCESVLLYEDNIINRTPYRIKCLVSVVLLIPVLLLQAREGVFQCKGDSLRLARLRYGDQISFEAIDFATEIRGTWWVSKASYGIRFFLIPFESTYYSPLWLQRIAGAAFPRHSPVIDRLFEESKVFSAQISRYAKNSIV
jgi:predicted nucleotidyltransferase